MLLPDEMGALGRSLGPAPADWPWALPTIHSVNAYTARGEQVIAASAGADGTYSEEHAVTDLGYMEVIGYWRGEFHVLACHEYPSLDVAQREAEATFLALAVRFLADRGVVVRENADVTVTGEWPKEWSITRYQELGVLCAYLFEGGVAAGHREQAELFRDMIVQAWPPTEQVLVYREALEFAQQAFVGRLALPFRNALAVGLETIRRY